MLSLGSTVLCRIISEWVSFESLPRMDTACCNQASRPSFLKLLEKCCFDTITWYNPLLLSWVVKKNVRTKSLKVSSYRQSGEFSGGGLVKCKKVIFVCDHVEAVPISDFLFNTEATSVLIRGFYMTEAFRVMAKQMGFIEHLKLDRSQISLVPFLEIVGSFGILKTLKLRWVDCARKPVWSDGMWRLFSTLQELSMDIYHYDVSSFDLSLTVDTILTHCSVLHSLKIDCMESADECLALHVYSASLHHFELTFTSASQYTINEQCLADFCAGCVHLQRVLLHCEVDISYECFLRILNESSHLDTLIVGAKMYNTQLQRRYYATSYLPAMYDNLNVEKGAVAFMSGIDDANCEVFMRQRGKELVSLALHKAVLSEPVCKMLPSFSHIVHLHFSSMFIYAVDSVIGKYFNLNLKSILHETEHCALAHMWKQLVNANTGCFLKFTVTNRFLMQNEAQTLKYLTLEVARNPQFFAEQLRTLDFVDHCLDIRSLYVSCHKLGNDFCAAFMAKYAATLRAIDFADCDCITDATLAFIVDCGVALRSVALSKCPNITRDGLAYLVTTATQLTELTLSSMDVYDTGTFIAIGNHMPQLEHLWITDCSVSKEGAKFVLSNCRKLKVFRVNNKHSLETNEINDMIEEHGVSLFAL